MFFLLPGTGTQSKNWKWGCGDGSQGVDFVSMRTWVSKELNKVGSPSNSSAREAETVHPSAVPDHPAKAYGKFQMSEGFCLKTKVPKKIKYKAGFQPPLHTPTDTHTIHSHKTWKIAKF